MVKRRIFAPVRVVLGGTCLVILLSCSSGHSSAAANESSSRLSLHHCELPDIQGDIRCGTYEVFEDRSAKSGRTIKLKVVVLKSLGSKPAPDAIFPLHGGPGAPATDLVELANGILGPVRQDHDLVFVDQRGTGGSNPLTCDVADDTNDLTSFFGDILPPDKVRACREKLQEHADLRLYTTPIAVDDLDEVRAALGYDKIDLVGLSYGTIASQVYMRQHPEHVRSAFLVGVATPNIKQPLLFPRSAQHAMDLLFADCTADETCHSAFPRLQEEFGVVLSRFNHGPLPVEMIDPVSKKRVQVKLSRSSFVEGIRLAMYSTFSQQFVPKIIHQAYEKDYVPFEEAAVHLSPGASVARGVYFTITCSEGVPFITAKELVDETKNTYVGPERVERHITACKNWPKGNIDSSYLEPVKSDLPVLMISGEVDGSSPTWFGESALKFLPNGRQLKIRYLGHQFEGDCLRDIFTSFIMDGSAKNLDSSCTEKIRRPPFATQFPPWFGFD
ncbi:MAG TPA: alpha/beta hydrolase [Candidatus Angelobacter sp.]